MEMTNSTIKRINLAQARLIPWRATSEVYLIDLDNNKLSLSKQYLVKIAVTSRF